MSVIIIEMVVKGKLIVIRCVIIRVLMNVQMDEHIQKNTMIQQHIDGIVRMRQDVISVNTKDQIIMVTAVLMDNL